MKDFYGYEREIKPNGQLVSSEFATLAIGDQGSASSEMSLVQGVQASYQQRAEPKFEAGSANLYWVAGQAMGDISMSRLVGASGMKGIASMQGGGGVLKALKIAFNGEGSLESATSAAGGLRFAGAIPLNIGITFSAGALEIGESVTVRAASMRMDEA